MKLSPCHPGGKTSAVTLEGLADAFLRDGARVHDREVSYYGKARNLSDAIRRAARSKLPNGKGGTIRHPHQRRRSEGTLGQLERHLLAKQGQIERASTFAELFAIVETAEIISDIGPLTVYDVTERIAAYKGLEPERVYLHSGAAIGGRALGLRGRSVEMASIPIALADRLTAAQLETFLCVCKDDLRRLVRNA